MSPQKRVCVLGEREKREKGKQTNTHTPNCRIKQVCPTHMRKTTVSNFIIFLYKNYTTFLKKHQNFDNPVLETIIYCKKCEKNPSKQLNS